ncbi:MAG: ABC transporter permease [Phycisphaeraceae bacterium]|nr:MAG: ABC transporter permease [Phycisphaeraceae bacterium]
MTTRLGSTTSSITPAVARARWPLSGAVGGAVVLFMLAICLGSLPWTLASTGAGPAYATGLVEDARRSPGDGYVLGTDHLGRSLLVRCLAGGAVSLLVGLASGILAVSIGTLYGAIAGYVGGRVDAVMMRVVDVLYGLPYVLLVVLLAVAGQAITEEYQARTKERASWVRAEAAQRIVEADQSAASPVSSRPSRETIDCWMVVNPAERDALEEAALVVLPPRVISERTRAALDAATLLVAIGCVSWLTMARVIRGQVLSLKERPFVEAARAAGASPVRVFARHLLPNLVGPIVVYTTLTVPQAILQESFLSFLGIGVRPPLPSWGNLAADGLAEINTFRSHWWLLAFPCVLLAATLLSLNFVGEALRESFDPRWRRRR